MAGYHARGIVGTFALLLAADAALAQSGVTPPPASLAVDPQEAVPQQATANPQTTAGDEILVTARRREESAQRVPISVVALSGEALERRQVTQALDLQRIAPGLTVDVQNNKPSTVQVGIRGQRMNQVFATQDPPTAIYFAEALMLPLQGLNSAFYDLQSVQVLKGPQGTLFGRNTTGGAVVITPAKPVHAFDGYVRGKVGNKDTYGLEGVLNVPVSSTLAVRASAKYEEHGGYQRYLPPVPAGRDPWEDHFFDGRFSVLWDPIDDVSNYFVGYYSHDANGAIGSDLVAINPNFAPAASLRPDLLPGSGRDPLDVYSPIGQFDVTQTYGGVNTTTVRTGDITFKNILSFRVVDNESRMNLAGTRTRMPVTLLTYQKAHHKSFSEEFQISGNALDNRFDWIAGLYYYYQRGSDIQGAPAYGNPSTNDTAITNQSTAGYVSANFKATDRLILSAGFRYTIDRRQATWRPLQRDLWSDVGIPFVASCGLRNAAGVQQPVTACQEYAAKTFRQPTWNASVNYQATEGVMLYATYRRGYRSGGFNSRALNAAQRVPFGPEKVDDYEIGAKTDFTLGTMPVRFNIDIYRDDYTGLQRQVNAVVPGFGLTPTSTIVNAASAKVDGLELELSLKPTPDLTLSGNYAYTKPTYRNFTNLVAGVRRDFSAVDLAGVPRNAVTAAIDYRLPVPEDVGRVNVTVNYSYTASTAIADLYQGKAQLAYLYTPAQLALIPDDTIFRAPAYSLVNASVGWQNIAQRPIDLTLYMKNVFDKRYPINGSSLYDILGITMLTYGTPRLFGAEVTYRFN